MNGVVDFRMLVVLLDSGVVFDLERLQIRSLSLFMEVKGLIGEVGQREDKYVTLFSVRCRLIFIHSLDYPEGDEGGRRHLASGTTLAYMQCVSTFWSHLRRLLGCSGAEMLGPILRCRTRPYLVDVL